MRDLRASLSSLRDSTISDDDAPLPSPHSRGTLTPRSPKNPGRVEIVQEHLEVDIRLRVMVDESCEMMRNMGSVLIRPRDFMEDLWSLPIGVLQERVEAAAAEDLELALVVSHLLGPSAALVKGPAAALNPRSMAKPKGGMKAKLPFSMTLHQLVVPRESKLTAECNMTE